MTTRILDSPRPQSDLARTLPGVHALLPSYRCVDEGDSARRLSPGDVAAIGGDAELARQAMELHDLVAEVPGSTRTVVGVEQPTTQSVVFRDGAVDPRHHTCEYDGPDGVRRVDRRGDGTVYRDSALGGPAPVYLPQTHGALAKTSLRAVLTETGLGPPLGGTAIGLHVSDVVSASEPFDIAVHVDGQPFTTTSCRIVDAVTGAGVARPVPRAGTGVLTSSVHAPGLYRVEAKAGGFSAVTELVLVTDREPVQ